MDLFKGVDGLTSAKRWIGFILSIGLLVIAGVGIFRDPSITADVMWPIGSVIAVTMGATAFERIKK